MATKRAISKTDIKWLGEKHLLIVLHEPEKNSYSINKNDHKQMKWQMM